MYSEYNIIMMYSSIRATYHVSRFRSVEILEVSDIGSVMPSNYLTFSGSLWIRIQKLSYAIGKILIVNWPIEPSKCRRHQGDYLFVRQIQVHPSRVHCGTYLHTNKGTTVTNSVRCKVIKSPFSYC